MNHRFELAKQYIRTLYGEDSYFPLEKTDPEFFSIKRNLIYGEVYAEEKLDACLRELIILTVSATNQTPSEVKLHTAAALRIGATPEKIKEAVYHCAPYIGLGKAESALKTVNDVLTENGICLPLAKAQTTNEETRLAQGISTQKTIFGESIDTMRASTPQNQKNIQDYLSAYCFGDFYTRKNLSLQERELLTFAILCALGDCEPQIKSHIKGNVAMGNGKEVLLATLTVCFPYIGFPRTLNALGYINMVLPE